MSDYRGRGWTCFDNDNGADDMSDEHPDCAKLEAFQRELNALCRKHGAEIRATDDGKPYGLALPLICVSVGIAESESSYIDGSDYSTDDDEPVTPEWLTGVAGFREQSEQTYMRMPFLMVSFWNETGMPGLRIGTSTCGWHSVTETPTRGDVRRLLAALGSPLKER